MFFLWLFFVLLHFSHRRSKRSSPSLSSNTFQSFQGTSDRLSEVSQFQQRTMLCSLCINNIPYKQYGIKFYWSRKFTERLKNKRYYFPRNNSLSEIAEAAIPAEENQNECRSNGNRLTWQKTSRCARNLLLKERMIQPYIIKGSFAGRTIVFPVIGNRLMFNLSVSNSET